MSHQSGFALAFRLPFAMRQHEDTQSPEARRDHEPGRAVLRRRPESGAEQQFSPTEEAARLGGEPPKTALCYNGRQGGRGA